MKGHFFNFGYGYFITGELPYFIAKTPNGLAVQAYNWEIPRTPVPAATFTQIPLLGTVAFTTTGLPIYGPNEAQHPDPYGGSLR